MTSRIGVIHLGLGAFHRAHQAVFIDHAIKNGHEEMYIASVSMRKSDVADSFASKGCKYDVVSADADSQIRTEISSIKEALFFPRDRHHLLELAASDDLTLITLTVTEKGYKSDGPESVPERVADLLIARFDARHKLSDPSIAVISCDNMPDNSHLLKKLVLEVLDSRDLPEVRAWVKEVIRFPNSMVDRIVPAITDADLTIVTEPFNQWVIQNDPLESILVPTGVQFVPDVKPFEIAKIRLFNGVHSTLAYLSELSGIEYVSEAIVHPKVAPFIKAMQEEEIFKSITNTGGIDLPSYAQTIRHRIANPTLKHRAEQIAMDGSQKLQQRIIDGMNLLAEHEIPAPRLCLAMAMWLHYLGVSDRVNDPMSKLLISLAKEPDSLEVTTLILSLDLFARKLNPIYFPQIAKYLEALKTTPALDMVAL
jgi:fructuronate reductase